jgi:hypothetical protein
VSARARKPPTQPPHPPGDDAPTTIYDGDEQPGRRRPASVTAKGSAPPPEPTVVDKPRAQTAPPVQNAPPIQAISMKTPGNALPLEAPAPTPVLPRPKLRGDVTPIPQQNLGNLAPPYDAKEARARSMREYVMWGCLAVILASVIALVVWFAAS